MLPEISPVSPQGVGIKTTWGQGDATKDHLDSTKRPSQTFRGRISAIWGTYYKRRLHLGAASGVIMMLHPCQFTRVPAGPNASQPAKKREEMAPKKTGRGLTK